MPTIKSIKTTGTTINQLELLDLSFSLNTQAVIFNLFGEKYRYVYAPLKKILKLLISHSNG